MNRAIRRKFYKENKKKLDEGSWKEWNDNQIKFQPYLNPEKKHIYDKK